MANIAGTNPGPGSSTSPDLVVGFQGNTRAYSYASATGTVNNVNASLPGFVGTVRLSVTLPSGNATWTGLAAGVDSQQVILRNVDPTYTLTLSTGGTGLGDTLSLAPNRFFGQNDYRLPPGGQITLVYYAYSTVGWSIG